MFKMFSPSLLLRFSLLNYPHLVTVLLMEDVLLIA